MTHLFGTWPDGGHSVNADTDPTRSSTPRWLRRRRGGKNQNRRCCGGSSRDGRAPSFFCIGWRLQENWPALPAISLFRSWIRISSPGSDFRLSRKMGAVRIRATHMATRGHSGRANDAQFHQLDTVVAAGTKPAGLATPHHGMAPVRGEM